jgi:hypothetical protein
MRGTTLGVGLLLILTGFGGYLGSGRVSKTALIPAPLGGLLVALGLAMGEQPGPPLYAAAAVAALGLAGSANGLPKAASLLAGQEVARLQAVIAKSVMALSCGAYLLLCLRTVLSARKHPG